MEIIINLEDLTNGTIEQISKELGCEIHGLDYIDDIVDWLIKNYSS